MYGLDFVSKERDWELNLNDSRIGQYLYSGGSISGSNSSSQVWNYGRRWENVGNLDSFVWLETCDSDW